ncbi:MAG: CheR family methyltransferase [Bryobacteraceae bacterium]|jgi:PAS domain S-box-containing protein
MQPRQHPQKARLDRAGEFFPNPAAFRILVDKVFPRLLKDRSPDDPVRIWVPGCSTGEDVYSIGIALLEYLREQSMSIPIRIFGSDLNDSSLRNARAAVYAGSAAQDVEPELLARYFTKTGSAYHVTRTLREQCIFAHQDAARNAPFSKLDLISCGNVLSHIRAPLQRVAVEKLRYALKPGGHLLMAESEDVQFPPDWFAVVDQDHHLFSKISDTGLQKVIRGFPPTQRERDTRKPYLPPRIPRGSQAPSGGARQLKRELAVVRQRLESTIEELEINIEELRSANAEVQSGNEELQCINEELEAARAELEFANQELETFNRELSKNNRQLLESNDDLSSLLSNVEVPVVMVDQHLRLRRFTPAAGKLLNLLATDLGRSLLDFKPRIEVPDLETLLHEVFDNLRVIEREVRDEQGHSYSMCVRPYRTPGNRIEGALMVLAEITERKKLEEQLRQAHKMEAIGRLAGGIAHDFNNILTAISGYAAELLNVLPASHPGRMPAEEISKVGDQAGMLTKQLLAISRKQVVRPRHVNLNDVLRDIHDLLRRLLGETVEIRYVLEADLGTVVADPGQIQQVIMNLAINARDAMARGGRLTLSTNNVFLDTRDAQAVGLSAGAYVTLTARDTGTGMGPATRERVFEPFFTTKPPGSGTGLGLSMVHGIVQQSGGSISLESEVGEGATVRIYFPRSVSTADQGLQEIHMSVPGGNETILLVEDSTVVRSVIQRVLAQRGYTVLEASDGTKALSLSSSYKGPIHLLLTDLLMPHMGGDELGKRMRRRRKGIKVIYMSGYPGDAFHAVKKDANFLEKPFKPEHLAAAVRKVLDE